VIGQIIAAIEPLEIEGASSYRWFGERFELPEPVRRLAPPEGLRAALTQALQWRLYADFFTAGAPVPARPRVAPPPDDGFTRALSAANRGTGANETGWVFQGHDGGRLMVERLGLRLWAEPEEVVVEGGREPVIGDLVSVRMSNEAVRLSPGFYLALSDVGLDPPRPRVMDRYYLHVRPAAAVECVKCVTERLNSARLPFRLKLLNDPAAYDRCDTAVLTMQRRQRREALERVRALAEILRPGLAETVPSMTLPLAPGVAFAEDPGDGVSFGAQRCGLIAAALVEAHELGRESEGGRMDLIRRHMSQVETTPEIPYLGPRSAGDPRALTGVHHDHEEVPSWR
jgi:hypothetical protein